MLKWRNTFEKFFPWEKYTAFIFIKKRTANFSVCFIIHSSSLGFRFDFWNIGFLFFMIRETFWLYIGSYKLFLIRGKGFSNVDFEGSAYKWMKLTHKEQPRFKIIMAF